MEIINGANTVLNKIQYKKVSLNSEPIYHKRMKAKIQTKRKKKDISTKKSVVSTVETPDSDCPMDTYSLISLAREGKSNRDRRKTSFEKGSDLSNRDLF